MEPRITIHNTWVDQIEDFRKKYEEMKQGYIDLGFNEAQAMIAICYGLSPIDMKTMYDNWRQLHIDIEAYWAGLVSAMQGLTDNGNLKELAQEVERPRNIKGKNLKPWEKKKFFQ